MDSTILKELLHHAMSHHDEVRPIFGIPLAVFHHVLTHLPHSLSFEHTGPLFCAGATIHTVQKANLKKGDVIGIVGLGALGHLGVQFAECMVNIPGSFDARVSLWFVSILERSLSI